MAGASVQLNLCLRSGEVKTFCEKLCLSEQQIDITSLHKAVKKIQTDVNNKLTEIVEQEKLSNNTNDETALDHDFDDEESEDSEEIDDEPKEKRQKR